MASIDTHLVRREIKAIAASSKAVKKLLYDALERLEENPSQFPELDDCPEGFATQYPNATLKKVRIERDPHSYRLIVVHWILTDDDPPDEHVDIIYAFPRKRGYPIDWTWVAEFMDEATE
ncbi:MAG TPA: hypothetical protein VFW73_04440 [Lacipirellulaceae bacterium]|nr:hypothetical protein [Lacipirellulaceae bacterium]